MLEHHTHALTQGIDVQFYGLAVFILIFLLGDIHTVKNDGTAGRLLQQVQAAQESRLSSYYRLSPRLILHSKYAMILEVGKQRQK